MVVVMRVWVVMVMGRMAGFRFLRATLAVWRVSTIDPFFVSRAPSTFLPASTTVPHSASSFFYLSHGSAYEIATFKMRSRTQS